MSVGDECSWRFQHPRCSQYRQIDVHADDGPATCSDFSGHPACSAANIHDAAALPVMLKERFLAPTQRSAAVELRLPGVMHVIEQADHVAIANIGVPRTNASHGHPCLRHPSRGSERTRGPPRGRPGERAMQNDLTIMSIRPGAQAIESVWYLRFCSHGSGCVSITSPTCHRQYWPSA